MSNVILFETIARTHKEVNAHKTYQLVNTATKVVGGKTYFIPQQPRCVKRTPLMSTKLFSSTDKNKQTLQKTNQ